MLTATDSVPQECREIPGLTDLLPDVPLSEELVVAYWIGVRRSHARAIYDLARNNPSLFLGEIARNLLQSAAQDVESLRRMLTEKD